MYAITTKYHGPTNYRGARISATTGEQTVFVSYPYEKSGEDVHRVALAALLAKVDYATDEQRNADNWTGGDTKTGYAFVYTK